MSKQNTFTLTDAERTTLIEQVVDTVTQAAASPKAVRSGLFFAAGVAALSGIDRETFLNAAAADFDNAKRGTQ